MAAAQSAFGTAVKGFREESAARIVRIDVLLLVAAIGLMACSIYTLGTATEDDIEGSPYYYVLRQSIYGGVGIALMLLTARFDYSRLRELKLGLYGVMLALDRARLPARGGRPRLTPLDRAALLPLPAVGARQGAPDPGPVGVRDRPDQTAAGPRDDQPGDAACAHPGDHGRRAAGPRLRACVPRDRHRRSSLSPGPRGRISRHSGASRRPPWRSCSSRLRPSA